jgi:esterase/lipase superfamily enzyme
MIGHHHHWVSPVLGRDMHVRWFGHGGARVLAFPTTMGNHNEWPDRRMPDVLAEHIEQGWITLFCVDHNHDDAWYNKAIHPTERARRHLRYDAYLRDELLPFTAYIDSNPFVVVTGASFGAYHAACFAWRHPGLVHRVIGMSGLYDIKHMTDGYSDEWVYQCNPSDFLRHEWDEGRLALLRRQDIILAVGDGDSAIENNRELSGTLWSKGVGNALRIWNGFAHDWPYWERMIRLYIGGHD